MPFSWYEIKFFDPQIASDEVWESYLDFNELIQREFFPDDPLPSRNTIKEIIQNPNPNFKNFRWLAFLRDNEKVIGSGNLIFYTETSPVYQENINIAFGEISVHQEYRRQGIGTEILKKIVKKTNSAGKTILQGGTISEVGKVFCQRYGGKVALVEEISRLKMVNIKWDLIKKWIWEGQKKAKGVTLNRFEVVPEESIEEYCNLYSEVMNQTPKGDLEWEFKETPTTRRLKEKRYKNLKNFWTTKITLENDGNISGLTETFYRSDQPSILHQGLTGVKEKYRGRGLGKWLKAEMIRYVKESFPNVQFIYTDFAITNAPMIEINKRLGFRLYKVNTEYKFQLNELCETLAI